MQIESIMQKKQQISYSDISNCFYMPNYNFFALLVRRVLYLESLAANFSRLQNHLAS